MRKKKTSEVTLYRKAYGTKCRDCVTNTKVSWKRTCQQEMRLREFAKGEVPSEFFNYGSGSTNG